MKIFSFNGSHFWFLGNLQTNWKCPVTLDSVWWALGWMFFFHVLLISWKRKSLLKFFFKSEHMSLRVPVIIGRLIDAWLTFHPNTFLIGFEEFFKIAYFSNKLFIKKSQNMDMKVRNKKRKNAWYQTFSDGANGVGNKYKKFK